MTTLLFSVAVLSLVILAGWAALQRSQVQSGYEDEMGFHYGTPKRRRK